MENSSCPSMSPAPPPVPPGGHGLLETSKGSHEPSLVSARSPQENPTSPLQKIQDFMPMVQSQYKAYEDVFVKKVKDGLIIVREHPIEACGVAVASGFILMQGPRRFLLRNSVGRLKSEEARFNEADSRLKELHQSVEQLKKESKNMLSRAQFGEETFQRGRIKLRDAGHEVQRLAKSIYRIESNAADLTDGLRDIPGRNALKLRAEVASIAAELKQQRYQLDKRIVKISEHGIRI